MLSGTCAPERALEPQPSVRACLPALVLTGVLKQTLLALSP